MPFDVYNVIAGIVDSVYWSLRLVLPFMIVLRLWGSFLNYDSVKWKMLVESVNITLLLASVLYFLSFGVEIFMSWYSPVDQYLYIIDSESLSGTQYPAPLIIYFCLFAVFPQLLWLKKFRTGLFIPGLIIFLYSFFPLILTGWVGGARHYFSFELGIMDYVFNLGRFLLIFFFIYASMYYIRNSGSAAAQGN